MAKAKKQEESGPRGRPVSLHPEGNATTEDVIRAALRVDPAKVDRRLERERLAAVKKKGKKVKSK